jgi:hypothetical protein
MGEEGVVVVLAAAAAAVAAALEDGALEDGDYLEITNY